MYSLKDKLENTDTHTHNAPEKNPYFKTEYSLYIPKLSLPNGLDSAEGKTKPILA